MGIVAIKGAFENAKAFLYHIAEDDQIEQFAIFVVRKDGTPLIANFQCTRANMAYASAALANEAVTG